MSTVSSLQLVRRKLRQRVEHQTRRYNGIKLMSLKLLKYQETRFPILDLHRWVACQAESYDFQNVVEQFTRDYGDFFDEDLEKIPEADDWREEWESISEAVMLCQSGTERGWPYLFENIWERLSELTDAGLFLHTSAKIVSKKTPQVAIQPNSWAGWCWALIARDMHEGITYKPCANDCGREVPSKTLTGRTGGKGGIRFCCTKCN